MGVFNRFLKFTNVHLKDTTHFLMKSKLLLLDSDDPINLLP